MEKTIAKVIRTAVYDDSVQQSFLLPENKHLLEAFVECGHQFKESLVRDFIHCADRLLIKTYIETGHSLTREHICAVLARKDPELTEAMIETKCWVPFPYGNTLSMPTGCHHHDDAYLDMLSEHAGPHQAISA